MSERDHPGLTGARWGAFGAALLALCALSVARAAPLQRNLGDGLVYFRLHAIPADLPADPAIGQHPAIVDVRFAKSDAGAATVFGSWLKFHAAHEHPILVLANATTSSAILAAIREVHAEDVLTVGIAAHHFAPEIAVEGSPVEEKRAYQALDDGATVASLITDHPDKQRNDEASLAASAANPTDDSLAADATPESPAPPPAPIDAALQRAVQLFHGLKALKVF